MQWNYLAIFPILLHNTVSSDYDIGDILQGELGENGNQGRQ